MIEEFSFWLNSIVEDDPIPYEVKHITFMYIENNNSFFVCVGGNEFKPNTNNMFDYFPLEAQFFYSKKMNEINSETYLKKLVVYCIDESFSSPYLKEQFMNRKIYICKRGEKPKFLFVVK